MIIPAEYTFEYYPDDEALSVLTTYAPMLSKDLSNYKKHWPTKSIMDRCFELARDLKITIPWFICPYILSNTIVQNSVADGLAVSATSKQYACNKLSQVFAWLTHQRVYEITKPQAEAIQKIELSENLSIEILKWLPEAGLHLVIPSTPNLHNNELLPSEICASLETYENPNNLFLILTINMRNRQEDFLLQIYDDSTKKYLTIEENMRRMDKSNPDTLYACIQILTTLISPNLKLRSKDDNLILLPSKRDKHPALDKSFIWPRKVTRCAVGWVGATETTSTEDLREIIWHRQRN